MISMLLVVGSAYLVGPDMYSRLLSARKPREAKIYLSDNISRAGYSIALDGAPLTGN